MYVTFKHDCLPKTDGQIGCPKAGKTVQIPTNSAEDWYILPQVRCRHTGAMLMPVIM